MLGALLIRSQMLKLSKAVRCSEAAHELYELIRVENKCRRVILNPGDLRWLENSFRHGTYTHYKAARLLIFSAIERVMCLGTEVLWLSLLPVPKCLLERKSACPPCFQTHVLRL